MQYRINMEAILSHYKAFKHFVDVIIINFDYVVHGEGFYIYVSSDFRYFYSTPTQ